MKDAGAFVQGLGLGVVIGVVVAVWVMAMMVSDGIRGWR